MALFTESETAVALGVSVRTLARWRASGNGPAFTRIANKIGYPEQTLIEWVAEHIHMAGQPVRRSQQELAAAA